MLNQSASDVQLYSMDGGIDERDKFEHSFSQSSVVHKIPPERDRMEDARIVRDKFEPSFSESSVVSKISTERDRMDGGIIKRDTFEYSCSASAYIMCESSTSGTISMGDRIGMEYDL